VCTNTIVLTSNIALRTLWTKWSTHLTLSMPITRVPYGANVIYCGICTLSLVKVTLVHYKAILSLLASNVSTYSMNLFRFYNLYVLLWLHISSSCKKSQRGALFTKFILIQNSICFGQIYCPSSGVSTLYTQQYVFVILMMLSVCWRGQNVPSWPR
jgi:hypothetical protein